MSGTSDKISGKTKETLGKATNNKDLEAKGKTQETKGHVKDKINSAAEVVTDKIDKTVNK